MRQRIGALQGIAAQAEPADRRKAMLEFLASQESWRVQRDADCRLEEELRDGSPNWKQAWFYSCMARQTTDRVRRIDEHLACVADDCYR